jgi:hypothetical protein
MGGDLPIEPGAETQQHKECPDHHRRSPQHAQPDATLLGNEKLTNHLQRIK